MGNLSLSCKMYFPRIDELEQSLHQKLTDYNKIGQEIRTYLDSHPEQDLFGITKEVCVGGVGSRMPFTFVCDSSGTGKTQQAFAAPESTKLLYLPLGVRESSQEIYRCFAPVSKLLDFCLNRDHNMLSDFNSKENYEKDSPYSYDNVNIFLSRYPSFVVGFLMWAANYCGHSPVQFLEAVSDVKVDITPQHGYGYSEWTEDLFVILDEFQPKTEAHRILRNTLCFLGIHVVVMSTDASAANYLNLNKTMSRSADPILWCFLFKTLPGNVMSDARIFEDERLLDPVKNYLKPFVRDCLQRSRPLFATYTREFLATLSPQISGGDMFKGLVQYVNYKMRNTKLKKEVNVRKAQFFQLLAATYLSAIPPKSVIDAQHLPSVNDHYARFSGENLKLYLAEKTLSVSLEPFLGYKPWHPTSFFPKVSDDPLLFLGSMYDQDSAFPGSSVASILDVYQETASGDPYASQTADKADGNVLEAIVAAATVFASLPREDFHGVPVQKFLLSFLRQLSPSPPALDELSLHIDPNVTLPDLKIPHFAPANQDWPKSLMENSSWVKKFLFDRLERTEDKYQVDVMARFANLILECKNYADALDVATFFGCIIRSRFYSVKKIAETFLHVVVTNTLQPNYSNMEVRSRVHGRDSTMTCKTFNCEGKEVSWNFQETVESGIFSFARVTREGSKYSVVPMFPMNPRSHQNALHLFFVVPLTDLKG